MMQPPSEPKQHPCRCETCECGKKRVRILYPNGEEKTRLVKCSKLNQTLTHEEIDIIALVGCASHSANTGAQARIDAVVKKLERLKYESYKHADKTQFCSSVHAFRGEGFAYGKAIALLKEGVGK